MPDQQKYIVSGYEPEAGGAVVFTFVPKGVQHERGPRGAPRRVPQYIVDVRGTPDRLDFDWGRSPDQPGPATDEIEEEITTRMRERFAWIDRVTELVAAVEQWARELGWATKRVEKKLDDARVGTHRIPALLMQADTCRIILEPVGRSAPGTDGVVDLYLMPAYDDIASIYHYEGRWNLHYVFPGQGPVAIVRDAQALPFSKESLGQVLAEMRQHAH
ncbi:MAG TPA: hypothetical protein VMV10_19690 [Pirellulales bacterium]|nr:hypothetical protein [Pirellulales bacterium]